MFVFFINLWEGLLFLVSYIKNGKVFPEPLDSGEEKKYISRMGKGDKTARNILIKHNLRLVAHIVKKYDSAHTDNEDLISIGTIGLIKGINTYDNSKNTKLATYAARCVENEILMHLRANKKKYQEKFLQEAIGSDKEGNEIKLMDIISTEDESTAKKVEKKLNCDRLYELLNELTVREKKVLEFRYGLNNQEKLTQREVASILGISRSYVSRIEKKAVQKLGGLFSDKGVS
ncbi:MAG: RNA polymerase sporulation sigma factor SigK [Bacillota bacterium]